MDLAAVLQTLVPAVAGIVTLVIVIRPVIVANSDAIPKLTEQVAELRGVLLLLPEQLAGSVTGALDKHAEDCEAREESRNSREHGAVNR